MRWVVAAAALFVAVALVAGQTTRLTYPDARPVIEAFSGSLPDDLTNGSQHDVESEWPAWVARRDAAIRSRLLRGDEDSLVNLWLYGTSFTAHPRATARETSNAILEQDVRARLEDFLDGVAAPGVNDRLRFARTVLATHGIDPSTTV